MIYSSNHYKLDGARTKQSVTISKRSIVRRTSKVWAFTTGVADASFSGSKRYKCTGVSSSH